MVDSFVSLLTFHGYTTWSKRSTVYAEWRRTFADNAYEMLIFDYELGTFYLINTVVMQTVQVTLVLIVCMAVVCPIPFTLYIPPKNYMNIIWAAYDFELDWLV